MPVVRFVYNYLNRIGKICQKLSGINRLTGFSMNDMLILVKTLKIWNIVPTLATIYDSDIE